MNLRGAKIQNFFKITADVIGGSESESSKEVRIPHYQRPFKWTENEISKLINDWYNNSKNDGDTEEKRMYFAGSIVTVASPNEAHQLIDGQQRFTTTFLANFICFLVTRVLLREAVIGRHIYPLENIFEQYKEAISYLFSGQKDNKNLKTELARIKNALDDFAKDNSENEGADLKRKETLEILMPLVGLPEVGINESNQNYSQKHKKSLRNFIELRTNAENSLRMALTYDRVLYNEELLESLTSTYVTLSSQNNPKININIDQKSSDTILSYTNALQVIFFHFDEIIDIKKNDDSFTYALELNKQIKRFLDEVSFCVVQTGNLNDAYTLFEVLNDRSLALDDLDLIKNQFYKKFVLANEKSLSSEKIDEIIQKIDDQWVSEVFKDEPDAKRNTIAYLAIVFITGKVTIKNRDGVSYRNAIENYLNNLTSYSVGDIQKHFNIFHSCKIFLDVFDVKFGKQTQHALKHELNLDSSIALKTVHFLVAIDQIGVLSGLVNYILLYTAINDNNQKFYPIEMRESFEKLLGRDCSEDVKIQAYDIWRISMLADKADKPRELAKQLIRDNRLGSVEPRRSPLSNEEYGSLLIDFKNWLRNWQYSQKSPKVRLLFSKLIKLSRNEQGELVEYEISAAVSSDTVQYLQLDHMEPRAPNNHTAYFQAHDRKQHVEGLGNMMILPRNLNIAKSNMPFSNPDLFSFYEKSGLENSFLLIDAENIYHQNKEENSGVPKSSFFDRRKEQLIKDFVEAIEIRPSF